ncbi:3'-5' exonuclease [Carnimonas bestiolae]|uniref:3'-5' exonuclease n=1 Tax=Carnimonas bestiolae TaxID=3402172 RepID=UPI003EDBD0EB
MKAKHISIDLETLGIAKNSVILSIAIVTDTGAELEIFPDIDAQIANGRVVDASTMLWWFGQSEANRKQQTDAPRVSLWIAIETIREFFDENLGKRTSVWGNSPSFDCDILADFGGGRPWDFWQERDVLTARMLVGHTRPSQSHSALSDARAQLEDVMKFMQVRDVMREGEQVNGRNG